MSRNEIITSSELIEQMHRLSPGHPSIRQIEEIANKHNAIVSGEKYDNPGSMTPMRTLGKAVVTTYIAKNVYQHFRKEEFSQATSTKSNWVTEFGIFKRTVEKETTVQKTFKK